jgi:hypothetical protein
MRSVIDIAGQNWNKQWNWNTNPLYDNYGYNKATQVENY